MERGVEIQSDRAARESLRAPRRPHLPWVLAVAYLLVIAYASLQPFRGWWTPPEEIRRFLTAPWPRYITLEDVLVNIAAYVPLGFLLARAFMLRARHSRAVLLAALLTCLLSMGMETVQMFMPSRIASNVDVLTNGLGGLIGALAAPLFSPTRLLGLRVARFRRAWFVYGPAADMGLVLLTLWLVTQFHATAQLFGTGNIRNTFELPVWFIHTPALLFASEAAIAAFNVLGIGIVVMGVTRDHGRKAAALASLLGAAFAVKGYTALAMEKSAGALAWLTPGVALGVVLAVVLLYGIARLPQRVQWIVGSICFAAAIVTINLAPGNPYQSVPVHLLAGPTHFLSFSGIVRALSELWPFLALGFTAGAAVGRPWHS